MPSVPQPRLFAAATAPPREARMIVRTFRYVVHSRVDAYLAAGWVFGAGLGLPHGCYSVLLEWPHDSEPIEPAAA